MEHEEFEDEIVIPVSPGTGTTALVAAALPFFISYTKSSSATVNGVVTESSFIDYAAVGGGAAALVLGVLGVALAAKGGDLKGKAMKFSAAAVALGAFQLIRGFGIV